VLATARAYATHALTATGAVSGLLALLAAARGDWSVMFAWLGVALVVDAIDGPLSRRYDAPVRAPIIDGALLDLVVDYLTYVFVPLFALIEAGLLAGRVGSAVALLVAFGSALYFADTRMKTADRSFSGFPACWNMVALVLFVVRPAPATVAWLLGVLAVLMFVPVRFVHPVRTARWRAVSLPVAVAWTGLAGIAVVAGLAPASWVVTGLAVTGGYLLVVGAVQQAVARRLAGRGPAA
jgi:phosphatidylcholine synthase